MDTDYDSAGREFHRSGAVSPTDPLTLIVVTIVLALVALTAACVPRETRDASRSGCGAAVSVDS